MSNILTGKFRVTGILTAGPLESYNRATTLLSESDGAISAELKITGPVDFNPRKVYNMTLIEEGESVRIYKNWSDMTHAEKVDYISGRPAKIAPTVDAHAVTIAQLKDRLEFIDRLNANHKEDLAFYKLREDAHLEKIRKLKSKKKGLKHHVKNLKDLCESRAFENSELSDVVLKLREVIDAKDIEYKKKLEAWIELAGKKRPLTAENCNERPLTIPTPDKKTNECKCCAGSGEDPIGNDCATCCETGQNNINAPKSRRT